MKFAGIDVAGAQFRRHFTQGERWSIPFEFVTLALWRVASFLRENGKPVDARRDRLRSLANDSWPKSAPRAHGYVRLHG